MIKKTIVIAGQQGERGDKAEEYSVPIDGVLGFTETGTPDGYVEAGYFKVTGLDEVDSRIDVIESLPEGSTSGDAEVADIRVGVDGEIYDSAGIAVRDQITELHDYAESIDDVQDAQIETMKVTKAVEGEHITIDDAASVPAESYQLTLSPVQSLNGYDSPWVGGAGKNKLDMTLAAIKTANTAGTWTGDVYTLNNLTFTFEQQDGYVTAIKVNGTADATTRLYVRPYQTGWFLDADTAYTMTGCPSGGGGSTYLLYVDANYALPNSTDTGNGATFTVNGSDASVKGYGIRITVYSGVQCNNLTFKPMIRLATVTDSTFAPYSNICPIHGADEVGVRVCGFNLFDEECELGIYNTTNGQKQDNTSNIRNKNPIPLLPNKAICWNNSVSNVIRFVFFDADNNFISAITGTEDSPYVFTTPQNAYFMGFYYNATTYNGTLCVNFNKTTGTPKNGDYVPYNGHSTTITLHSTVYGGSVEMGGSGEVTFGLIDLSTQSTWFSDAPNSDGFIRYVTPITGKASNYNIYCSSFKVSDTVIPGTATEEAISGYYANNNIYFAINSNRLTGDLTTADGRKAALLTWLQNNTVTVAYELATPTDISVTPFPQTLLEGVNNVWAECSEDGAVIGDAEQDLTYQRDTTLVIQNLINRIEELERRN